jgi:hypothetical protein
MLTCGIGAAAIIRPLKCYITMLMSERALYLL